MELTENGIVNAPRCVLAIDPGLSGAVFKIGRGSFVGWRDFKTEPEIALAVKNLASEAPEPEFAVIEAVHAFPGQGVCSVWSFAEATGYAKASLCLLLPNVRAFEVPPQRWQKFFRDTLGLGRKEFDSRSIACQLLPSYADYFKRKKDHNSADAALIGIWSLFNV